MALMRDSRAEKPVDPGKNTTVRDPAFFIIQMFP